jgi:sensor histidine kinase YesM
MNRKTRYIAISLHVLVWGTILLIPYLFKMPVQNKVGFLEYPAAYFDITNLLNAGLFYFNAYIILPTFFKRKKWTAYLICILIVITVVTLIKVLILKWWFVNIEVDEWSYRFAFFSTVGFMLISSLYGMVEDNLRMEKKQKEIIAARMSAELKFYRSQISPHFLFNVLSTIILLGRRKSDQLEPSLIMLSDLIRYMLFDAKENSVSLSKEIENLRSYIALQQLRFGQDDVTIETNLSVLGGENGFKIEPMILIPFVENAFKHGIGRVHNPMIKVNLEIIDGVLYFQVLNKFSGNQINGKEAGLGIGLINIKSRLNLLYGEKHQLEINQANSVFDVKLKLHLK